MLQIFNYWYKQSFGLFYHGFRRTLDGLEESLAVKSTARNLNKPLFQDYTFQGRVIGLLLRLIRICLGCLLYFLLAVAYLFMYVFWLLFPFLCIVSLVGAVAA